MDCGECGFSGDSCWECVLSIARHLTRMECQANVFFPMTPKKKSKSPKKIQPSYEGILLEDMQSKFDAVIDHMNGVEVRLTQRMDERFSQHDQRFDTIEAVLREHSRKFGEIENKLVDHDRRFDVLETKLDRVVEKVEYHNGSILELKAAVGRS